MTTPVIIDVIMAVVLIAAVIYGAHRGLFRALAGLAVVIVALVGAAIIANTLAAPAARLVTPLIREQIETKVDEAMARQSQEVQMPEEDVDEGFAIEDLLALMGLDEDVRNSLLILLRSQGITARGFVSGADFFERLPQGVKPAVEPDE